METAVRKSIDCREFGGDCSLKISGTENEVLDLAVLHAVTKHAHADEPGLRDELRSALKPD